MERSRARQLTREAYTSTVSEEAGRPPVGDGALGPYIRAEPEPWKAQLGGAGRQETGTAGSREAEIRGGR